MFIGTWDIPRIVPKAFLPKYSPRIDTRSGTLPPNPMPKMNANRKAIGRLLHIANMSIPNPWIVMNIAISGGFGKRSPRNPENTWTTTAVVV
tara:strand:+ start:241 stop:516 length:276 start_codon:yes stop_codon:yes gene_type:complete